jgi:predicted nucleotidyltransferase component of viral defense system
MSLDPELVNDVATDLGIDPAFVEKDWHAVQVLKAIAEHTTTIIETIFAGGTSLSKGYGLIQRFSEDLDFRCRYISPSSKNQNKKVRSTYRLETLNKLQCIKHIDFDHSQVGIASNLIKIPLNYIHRHDRHTALRPKLEVEFSFTQPQLLPQCKSIQSFISEHLGGTPETEILCLSPIETGADKLSALTWRILRRDRNLKSDDAAMIRHLHDLYALSPIIEQERSVFIETALHSFSQDQQILKRKTDAELYPSLKMALAQLRSDKLYRQEYERFVDSMSYADDDNRIVFDAALASLERMISFFES